MKAALQKFFRSLKPLWRLWLKIAHFIGKVNTLILLTLFYVFILGIARIVTLLGRKDLLDVSWKDRASYWNNREKLAMTQEAFKKPY